VTYEEALTHATNPDDFALTFRGVSKGGSSIEEPPSSAAGPERGRRPDQAPPPSQDADDGAPDAFRIDRFSR